MPTANPRYTKTACNAPLPPWLGWLFLLGFMLLAWSALATETVLSTTSDVRFPGKKGRAIAFHQGDTIDYTVTLQSAGSAFPVSTNAIPVWEIVERTTTNTVGWLAATGTVTDAASGVLNFTAADTDTALTAGSQYESFVRLYQVDGSTTNRTTVLWTDLTVLWHPDAELLTPASPYTNSPVFNVTLGGGGGGSGALTAVAVTGGRLTVTDGTGPVPSVGLTDSAILTAWETETGRTVATDAAKLDGIEAAATADQTDAEIETAYNAQVAQVTAGEKTAGSETAVRRFSPKDVADMAGTHGGGGATDHGALTGLGDDDHTQYLLADGSRAYTGDADFGGFAITNAANATLADDVVVGSSEEVKLSDGTLFLRERATRAEPGTPVEAGVGQLWYEEFTPGDPEALVWVTDSESKDLTDFEAGADVTDADNVTAALSGATIPTVVSVAGDDKVLVQDTSGGDSLVQVAAQDIADLGVTDHGALAGLGDDDHTQYLLADGSRTATELDVSGNVDVGGLLYVTSGNYIGFNEGSSAYVMYESGGTLFTQSSGPVQVDAIGDVIMNTPTLDVNGDGDFSGDLTLSGTNPQIGGPSTGTTTLRTSGSVDGNDLLLESGDAITLTANGGSDGAGALVTFDMSGAASSNDGEVSIDDAATFDVNATTTDFSGAVTVNGLLTINNNAYFPDGTGIAWDAGFAEDYIYLATGVEFAMNFREPINISNSTGAPTDDITITTADDVIVNGVGSSLFDVNMEADFSGNVSVGGDLAMPGGALTLNAGGTSLIQDDGTDVILLSGNDFILVPNQAAGGNDKVEIFDGDLDLSDGYHVEWGGNTYIEGSEAAGTISINTGTEVDVVAPVFDVDAAGTVELTGESGITLDDGGGGGSLDVNMNASFYGDVTLGSPTVPANAGSTGTAGMVAWDADYIYICVATNTWKRAAISTW